MSQISAFDASIPVLTEVFQGEASAQAARQEAPEPTVPAERIDAAPPTEEQAGAALEARAIDSWNEPEWSLLERRLSERILQQLQGKVDFVLEQRVRDSMEAVLQQAIGGLTDEIREGLQQTIDKIVRRSVAQELAHLQTLKQ